MSEKLLTSNFKLKKIQSTTSRFDKKYKVQQADLTAVTVTANRN